MRLDPGPIPVLAPAVNAIQPEAAEFSPLAQESLADAETLEAQISAAVDGSRDSWTPPDFDVFITHIDEASAGTFDAFGTDQEIGIDAIQDSSNHVVQELLDSNREAPAEMWQPVPISFPIEGVTGPFPGVVGPINLVVTNLSHPGDILINPGDKFKLDFSITSGGGNFDFAGIALQLQIHVNDDLIGAPIDMGATNEFGLLTYIFTPPSFDVAVFVNAAVLPPNNFTTPEVLWHFVPLAVTPPPPPPPPPPVVTHRITAVSIGNMNTGSHTAFTVGDGWIITVTGDPGSTVRVSITNNGVQIANQSLFGTIPASGVLQVTGTMLAANIGTFVETYSSEDGTFATPIQFTVAAVQAPPPPPPPPPVLQVTSAQIQNLSGGSSTDFRVGDQFKLLISGTPGAAVIVYSTRDSVTQANFVNIGNFDGNGNYSFVGTFDFEMRGSWAEYFYAGTDRSGYHPIFFTIT